MRKVLVFLLLASVAPLDHALADADIENALGQVAQTLTDQMSAAGIRKLAVVQFSDLAGYESALGLFVAEELTTKIFEISPGNFDIVERQQLQKILKEQKLTASSLFDAQTIEDLGRILGIEALVTGSIADLGDSIKINARSISVKTGKVFAAASAKCGKDSVVQQLLAQGAAPNLRSDSAQDGNAGPHRRQIQASDVFFQNKYIRLTVQSMALSDDLFHATLALVLENLMPTDLLLAMESKGYNCDAGLIDDKGNHFGSGDFYDEGVTGIVCLSFDPRRPPPAEAFTRISGKSRTTVVIYFEMRGRRTGPPEVGTVFAAGIDFLLLEQGKINRFSAGLSNIQARH